MAVIKARLYSIVNTGCGFRSRLLRGGFFPEVSFTLWHIGDFIECTGIEKEGCRENAAVCIAGFACGRSTIVKTTYQSRFDRFSLAKTGGIY